MYPGPPRPRWNARAQSWEYDAGDESAMVPDGGTGTGTSVRAEPGEAAHLPDGPALDHRLTAPPDTPRPGPGRHPLTRPPVPWQPPDEDAPAGGRSGAQGRGAGEAGPGVSGPRPRPMPGARRPRRLVAGLAAVALVAAAAWWLAGTGDGGGPGEAGRPASTAFPTASPTAPGSDYRIAAGPGGASLAVPRDWSYQVSGTTHGYVAPDHASFLEVSPAPADLHPLEAGRAFSSSVRSVWPGYEEMSLGPVGDGPRAAVEVDFAYDATDGTRRRGLYRVFTAPDSTVYGVQVAGPSTDWPRQRQIMDTMLSTFYVPGASF
ncbi:hypothetical protein [Streptomyces sp. NRRL S-118]|uniref:hypothetical protein n=1 Tax=Streptomyces sp. NRRL S-118 TaxID=1463881 RepID=UPI0004C8541B|nr:hypothetical protein [Streptomyces sp. NRRL S-118]